MSVPQPIEPFRAVAVEPIHTTTIQQRRQFLREADDNLFRLRSDQVLIDLLTDSGTGAMSSAQWAAMMQGDESYAGSMSYHRLNATVRQITGLPHMLPTHQGRVAERLLVDAVIGKHPAGVGKIVPNNAHFDTTRWMIESSGAETVNLIDDLRLSIDDSERCGATCSENRFAGDMSIAKLERLLQTRGNDVPFVMMTVTCNSNGGQPVSLANLQAVREVCNRFGKMLFLDACRYAENAWFVKNRTEDGGLRTVSALRSPQSSPLSPSIPSIVRAMFDLADGAVMSTRKDALCNVGGLLLMRDERHYRKACNLCVLTEGFQMTYGSLPGRDLEAIAIGLQEAMDENYLTSRINAVHSLGRKLAEGGVRIVEPVGGHAVFIDAEDFCPHLTRADNPAHSLACAIYEHAGIRSTRIGTVLKNDRGEPMEIVRLAIPRRRYSQAQLDYVAESIVDLKLHAHGIAPIRSTPPITIVPAGMQRTALQTA